MPYCDAGQEEGDGKRSDAQGRGGPDRSGRGATALRAAEDVDPVVLADQKM